MFLQLNANLMQLVILLLIASLGVLHKNCQTIVKFHTVTHLLEVVLPLIHQNQPVLRRTNVLIAFQLILVKLQFVWEMQQLDFHNVTDRQYLVMIERTAQLIHVMFKLDCVEIFTTSLAFVHKEVLVERTLTAQSGEEDKDSILIVLHQFAINLLELVEQFPLIKTVVTKLVNFSALHQEIHVNHQFASMMPIATFNVLWHQHYAQETDASLEDVTKQLAYVNIQETQLFLFVTILFVIAHLIVMLGDKVKNSMPTVPKFTVTLALWLVLQFTQTQDVVTLNLENVDWNVFLKTTVQALIVQLMLLLDNTVAMWHKRIALMEIHVLSTFAIQLDANINTYLDQVVLIVSMMLIVLNWEKNSMLLTNVNMHFATEKWVLAEFFQFKILLVHQDFVIKHVHQEMLVKQQVVSEVLLIQTTSHVYILLLFVTIKKAAPTIHVTSL
jgi:hypothetical protein